MKYVWIIVAAAFLASSSFANPGALWGHAKAGRWDIVLEWLKQQPDVEIDFIPAGETTSVRDLIPTAPEPFKSQLLALLEGDETGVPLLAIQPAPILDPTTSGGIGFAAQMGERAARMREQFERQRQEDPVIQHIEWLRIELNFLRQITAEIAELKSLEDFAQLMEILALRLEAHKEQLEELERNFGAREELIATLLDIRNGVAALLPAFDANPNLVARGETPEARYEPLIALQRVFDRVTTVTRATPIKVVTATNKPPEEQLAIEVRDRERLAFEHPELFPHHMADIFALWDIVTIDAFRRAVENPRDFNNVRLASPHVFRRTRQGHFRVERLQPLHMRIRNAVGDGVDPLIVRRAVAYLPIGRLETIHTALERMDHPDNTIELVEALPITFGRRAIAIAAVVYAEGSSVAALSLGWWLAVRSGTGAIVGAAFATAAWAGLNIPVYIVAKDQFAGLVSFLKIRWALGTVRRWL